MEEEKEEQEEAGAMEDAGAQETNAEISAEEASENVQVEDTETTGEAGGFRISPRKGVFHGSYNQDEAVTEEHADILHIGIDLGTYRSSITASNGRKGSVLSVVGWPKDAVALKLLGKPIIFGEEAMTHRLSLDLHRPLERGVLKEETNRDRRSVGELVRHVIELVEPSPGGRIYGVLGAPARASTINKQALVDAVSGLLTAVMVVPEPFSVAYGLGTLEHALVVDIGAGTTDFCRVHGAMPPEENLRTLYKAGDYIDEQLLELVQEEYEEAQVAIQMIRKYKEQHSFVSEIEQTISVEFPMAGKPVLCDITEEIKKACESIIPETMEMIEELIATADPEFQETLRGNIILAGGGSQIAGLAALIERELAHLGGSHVTVVEDAIYAGSDGALKLAMDLPVGYWRQLE